jgi:hypothetical protein
MAITSGLDFVEMKLMTLLVIEQRFRGHPAHILLDQYSTLNQNYGVPHYGILCMLISPVSV